MKFYEVAEEWFDVKMIGLSMQYQKSVQSSIQHLCNHFGNFDISEIKPRDMDILISKLATRNPNTGKPMAKKTLSQIIRVANNIFEYAIENEIISKSPAYKKKPPKKCIKTCRRSLNNNEKALILTTQHRAKLPAMIMLLAGLRRGEIIALKWSDINIEQRCITVDKAAAAVSGNKFCINPHTKNGGKRQVFIPELLLHYLLEEQQKAVYPLITSKTDGNMHTPSSWRQMWASYNKALNMRNNQEIGRSLYNPNGIPKSLDDITAHMLRHTYATMLWTAGVDVKSAAKLLGHSDISTTLAIYTHLEKEKEVVSIAVFDNYINQKLCRLRQELFNQIIFDTI